MEYFNAFMGKSYAVVYTNKSSFYFYKPGTNWGNALKYCTLQPMPIKQSPSSHRSKKQTDNWYQNKIWNGDIDSRFEKQLRHVRNETHKAEYLQVQGCLLLLNSSEKIQEVGLVLLDRLREEHPKAYCQNLAAQEKLGDYFFSKKQYEKAAAYLKMVTTYCVQQQSRSNTSGMADLKWANALYKTNDAEALQMATALLQLYPVALLKTPEQKAYYAQLQSQINEAMENKTPLL